jgi:hypothetical protein
MGELLLLLFEILFSKQPVCLFLALTINSTENMEPEGVQFFLVKSALSYGK